MRVKIYQIKDFENCNYMFRSYDKAVENGFSMNDYEEVYETLYVNIPSERNNYRVLIGENEKMKLLESLFTKFNTNRPDDFKGHSLSVSDVVALGNELYYCDNCGWRLI